MLGNLVWSSGEVVIADEKYELGRAKKAKWDKIVLLVRIQTPHFPKGERLDHQFTEFHFGNVLLAETHLYASPLFDGLTIG